MVDKSIFQDFAIDEAAIEEQVDLALKSGGHEDMLAIIDKTVSSLTPGAILKGKIVNYIGDDVIIEVGLKSEGSVSSSEFDDPSEIRIGDSVEVLLEAVESDSGLVQLSKKKADRIRGWERILEMYKENDTIKGRCTRRIKGGLLVDVGVPVFLPASQIDIRRPNDISEFIGNEIQAKILKIDEERRNIVISRRKLLEETRASAKSALLEDIEVGQIRKGVVKNIADFGAFVDLGGLDGLLHITDMSWGRVNHPTEIVRMDQRIEVKILSIDREREKIALGIKQKTESPWITAEERYPIHGVVKGQVVNITNYGAFIKLEEGVEGLVHISEMSWTKRISHPSEMLSVGQEIEVVVLSVNAAKQEISLGIKQLSENPWTQVVNKYPPGTIVEGTIRNLANYGAFIEIEEGVDGLLHVSDMSWTKKINHPGEMLKKNERIKCIVLSVDQEKQRVALGMKQMSEDPWLRAIPEKYLPGQIVQGKVTKITNFGVFIELEPDLEGLLHVSELSDEKVDSPQDVVKVGEEVEVKILRVDIDERKIGLSLKRARWAAEDAEQEASKPMQRGGLDGMAGMGTDVIDSSSIFKKPASTKETPTTTKPVIPKESAAPAAEPEPVVPAAAEVETPKPDIQVSQDDTEAVRTEEQALNTDTQEIPEDSQEETSSDNINPEEPEKTQEGS
ncbi:MAG: 30S ribosomal protein S1 [Sedimentisphaerales bacterium]|nr:30S ribosomal protein S1 [Sedimentisphaerales bacterium]